MKVPTGPVFALCSLLLLLLLLQVPGSYGLVPQLRGKRTMGNGDAGSTAPDRWCEKLSTDADGG